MYPDDTLSPDQRFHQVAAILAAGLLRLKSRPGAAAELDVSAGKEALDSVRKPLECPAGKRLHVSTGLAISESRERSTR